LVSVDYEAAWDCTGLGAVEKRNTSAAATRFSSHSLLK